MHNIVPTRIQVSDDTLIDLDARLNRASIAPDFGNDDWCYGFNGEYLAELVAYWHNTYDWRAHEAAINAFPHFKTVIDDVPIHFIHVKGIGPNPVPLILTHGWPGSFWDYRKVIDPLSNPGAFGGDPDDAFDVIVPSLPGYGFSSPLTKKGINFWNTADLWIKLMERLGYERFAAYGEDWGAFVTAQLGHKYADRMIGTHFTMMIPLDLFGGGEAEPLWSEEEKEWPARNECFFRKEMGYANIQGTKPQTLAYALQDSPVGLCAWIAEKLRSWGHTNGDIEHRFSKDDILTTVMIYWVTQTFGTSARYYYEAYNNLWRPSHDRTPVVEAPTAISLQLNDVFLQPRRWAERYYNLQQWNVHPKGGHFAAFEEPQTISDDIRRFIRQLRQ